MVIDSIKFSVSIMMGILPDSTRWDDKAQCGLYIRHAPVEGTKHCWHLVVRYLESESERETIK